MEVEFLDLQRHYFEIEKEINQAVSRVLKSGWYIGGEEVASFEKNFSGYIHCAHCISCGNGTDALEIILRALEIGVEDEVIVPAFTWVSEAEAVLAVGGNVVFADVDADGNISAAAVEKKITAHTKAVIGVHLYGKMCDVEALAALCKKHNIFFIEDAAQAHGASSGDKVVGTFGDAAIFSFYPTKNLGAYGDGGAITTNNNELAEQVRLITDHGQSSRDVHHRAGRNSRLDPVQAAILNVKMEHLERYTLQREVLAKRYIEAFQALPINLPADVKSRVWHLFVIEALQRDKLKRYLQEKGVKTAIHYGNALSKMNIYKTADQPYPVAERLAAQSLSLPLYPELKAEEQEYVIEKIQAFFIK